MTLHDVYFATRLAIVRYPDTRVRLIDHVDGGVVVQLREQIGDQLYTGAAHVTSELLELPASAADMLAARLAEQWRARTAMARTGRSMRQIAQAWGDMVRGAARASSSVQAFIALAGTAPDMFERRPQG